MKKSLLSVLVFLVSLIGVYAQNQPTLGGHPEDRPATHTTHDGSNTLGQSYYRHDVCGLNFVEADTLVETRSTTYGFNANGTGIPTFVNIHGLPTGCDSIVKAYLYWVQSYTVGNGDPTSLTVTNPAAANFNYTVNNIGLSVGQNWGDIGTATYRADVTNSISGNGKYNINITGSGTMSNEIDGVSLIIIYRDYAATYTGSITLFDGADAECTSGITLNYTGNGFSTCAASPNAVAFGLFGDMQSNIGTGTNVQTFNGSTATFTNNFWNYDAITTTLTAGQNSIVYNTYTNDLSDCYVISLLGLYWQNTSCVTCTVGSSKLNLTMTQTPASCGANNGSANVTTTGGTPPYTYNWSTGATTSSITNMPPGTYTVTVKDAGCDNAIDSVKITTSTLPLTVKTSSGGSFCLGGTGTLNAKGAGGDSIYTYTWNPGNIIGQTIVVSPTVTTTYTVTLTDGCSSAPAKGTVVVTVNPQPSIAFGVDSANGCYPLCVNFTNNTIIASGTVKTWQWSFGDGGTSTSQNPHYCYTKPGVYTVTLIAISDSGCKQQLFINNMITVYDHPHANFTYAPQLVTILQPNVQFTDLSVDQYGINKWFWSFGDPADSTSTVQNPSHTYADTGTFCTSLTVTNIHNCTDAVEKCIIVEPFFALYVPDAFTPNHDGLNDVFLAEGKYICSFEMWIFDRWGMQIFHSTDITKGWNGTVGGDSKQVQEDTYVYLIKAQDCRDGQHQLHTLIGKVTLLR